MASDNVLIVELILSTLFMDGLSHYWLNEWCFECHNHVQKLTYITFSPKSTADYKVSRSLYELKRHFSEWVTVTRWSKVGEEEWSVRIDWTVFWTIKWPFRNHNPEPQDEDIVSGIWSWKHMILISNDCQKMFSPLCTSKISPLSY
jgi:hypothetical protein